MTDLAELVAELKRRPAMFLPDMSFAALVAFIEGFALGSDGDPLNGFQDFVAMELRGARSPQHWGVLAASMMNDEIKNGHTGLSEMTIAEQARASELLLELIGRFLNTQPGSSVDQLFR